jgi:hypothetical protein
MSNKKRYLRAMAISFFVLVISFFNFTRLAGTECVRTIHVVTLLICGIGIGVFIVNFFGMLRSK